MDVLTPKPLIKHNMEISTTFQTDLIIIATQNKSIKKNCNQTFSLKVAFFLFAASVFLFCFSLFFFFFCSPLNVYLPIRSVALIRRKFCCDETLCFNEEPCSDEISGSINTSAYKLPFLRLININNQRNGRILKEKGRGKKDRVERN